MSTDARAGVGSVDFVDIVDGVVRPSLHTPDIELGGAHLWRIHWPEIEPTVIRYQEAVTLDRVLSEHHAAVGAEPMQAEGSRSAGLIAGPPESNSQSGDRRREIPLGHAFYAKATKPGNT